MILDLGKFCKTYDKDIYDREYFRHTPCPACRAVGRFRMHGSYHRHVIYFSGGRIIYRRMPIKRIFCESCKTTHAVLPCDIIPYKALSLFVFIYVLIMILIKEVPVLEIAEKCEFSYQLVYSAVDAFKRHMNRILQHIRETSPEDTPADPDARGVLSLIGRPYTEFQRGYIENNRRACFMCKFFDGIGAPPVGIHAAARA